MSSEKEKEEKKIVVSIKDDVDKSQRPDWAGSSSIVDKLAKVLDAEASGETGMMLPSTLTMEDIKRWIPKVTKSMTKKNPHERHDGRTGVEVWAHPTAYANLDASQGGGGGRDSLNDVGERKINVADLIFMEIFTHGRQTITEVVGNIGAIDEPMLVLVTNAMLLDKFLRVYKEKDGLETLELVEHHERNRSLGYTDKEEKDKKPKELEDKNAPKKEVKKDVVSKMPVFLAVPVIETPEELKDQKEKSPP